MFGLKLIDTFVLKKYLTLFLGCFLICQFVCMMQFVWRYINELVGKGLGPDILGAFFWYMGLTLVPMALPLAILLTSLITFGNMGEQLEILAFKAAGVPLMRILRPVIITSAMLSGVSFCFQNYIGPNAQKELAGLILSMKETSPALEIPEGVFYNGIPNVNLYVESKDVKTGMLYNVIIYKIDQGVENAQIVVADSARLEVTADKHFLTLDIFHGEQFENLQSGASPMLERSQVPYDRETFQFKSFLIDYDTGMGEADKDNINNMADVKSVSELDLGIDSLTAVYDSIGRDFFNMTVLKYITTGHMTARDSAAAIRLAKTVNMDSLDAGLPQQQRLKALKTASSTVDNLLTELEFVAPVSKDGYKQVRKHQIKWHEKFASSLTCLLFFFIGAPLGSIIRKGGLGVSVLISVLIFVVYYVISTGTMKSAREGNLYVGIAMWTSIAVLTPLAVFLTYKTNKDSVAFSMDGIKLFLRRIMGRRDKRQLVLKEIILQTPDYVLNVQRMLELEKQCADVMSQLKLSSLPSYISMFFKPQQEDAVAAMADNLNEMVGALAYSEDRGVVNLLNDYPIMSKNAHRSPLAKSWVRIVAGIVLPVGLAIWFYVLRGRRLLHKDINQILKTNTNMKYWFKKQNIVEIPQAQIDLKFPKLQNTEELNN